MITTQQLDLIKEAVTRLKEDNPKPLSAVCLGYPDAAYDEDREVVFKFLKKNFNEVTVLDVYQHRGFEHVVDLNEWVPDIAPADFLLDSGTLEHCFNIGRAFRSAAELVAVGGYLSLTGPLVMQNHGYWSYNPVAIIDGLEQNGFEVLTIRAVPFKRVFQLKLNDRRDFYPVQEYFQTSLAKKIEDVPWQWPIQQKYKDTTK